MESTGFGHVPDILPVATDDRRRGRRAFSGSPSDPGEDAGAPAFAQVMMPAYPQGRELIETEVNVEQMRAEVLARLESVLPSLVRDAVESYCERHFKSLAREVIATELRRLADEKARHLVDP